MASIRREASVVASIATGVIATFSALRAHAQQPKPGAPSNMTPPAPAAVPALSLHIPPTPLKAGLKLIDTGAKLKLIGPIQPGATERNLDTPFRLDSRTPYINPKTYLTVNQAIWFVTGGEDQPRIDIEGYRPPRTHPWFSITFAGDAERAYIIDCTATAVGEYTIHLAVEGQTTSVNSTRAADGHFTAVVRKLAAPKKISFTIRPEGPIGLTIGTCEVTPVK